MQDLEIVKELIAAGEKATQGIWYEDSHRPDQATIKVKGNTKLVVPNYRGSQDPTLCVFQANLIQDDETKKDTADFIAAAANARPALLKLVERVEDMRKLIISFEKATDKHCDSYSQEMMELVLDIYALEKDE